MRLCGGGGAAEVQRCGGGARMRRCGALKGRSPYSSHTNSGGKQKSTLSGMCSTAAVVFSVDGLLQCVAVVAGGPLSVRSKALAMALVLALLTLAMAPVLALLISARRRGAVYPVEAFDRAAKARRRGVAPRERGARIPSRETTALPARRWTAALKRRGRPPARSTR